MIQRILILCIFNLVFLNGKEKLDINFCSLNELQTLPLSDVKILKLHQSLSYEKINSIYDLLYIDGIDIKNFKNKNYILEINSIPSWKGLQTVESKNITKILVRDFIFLIKKLQKIYVN